jgi:hypothetical protein
MNVWPITSNCHASMLLVTQVFQERLLGSRQWPDSMMTMVKWCQMMANGTTLTTWKKHRHCVLGKVQYGDQDDLQQQKPHNFAAPWSQLKSQNDHETLGPPTTQFRDYVMTTSCYSHLQYSHLLTSTHIYSLGDQETGTSTPSRSQLLWWGKSHLYLPGKPWDLDPWSSAAALWSWSSCHTYKDVHKDAACSMNRNED